MSNIFRDEEDFKVYLTILEESLIYYSHLNYELVAYCLMDNHVHLIIKIEELLFEMEIRGYIKQVSGMFTVMIEDME